MTSEQGGAIANRQGNILEQQVRQAFASHGFREVAFAEYEKLASGSTLPGVPVPDLLVRRALPVHLRAPGGDGVPGRFGLPRARHPH